MWIFTNKGYVSVVEDFDNREVLLVRARKLDHLVGFIGSDERVFLDESADYPYRVFVERGDFEEALVARAKEINYPNFKNSVADPVYHSLLSRVWQIMSVLGMGSRYRGFKPRDRDFIDQEPEDFSSPALDDFIEDFDTQGARRR